jgi:hypothetical protein
MWHCNIFQNIEYFVEALLRVPPSLTVTTLIFLMGGDARSLKKPANIK